jgi:hypothetical protein
LREILLSKDLDNLEKNRWIFSDGSKFLDGADLSGFKIAYATFPRTGNTLLRKYIEEITGVATGADMSLDLTLGF